MPVYKYVGIAAQGGKQVRGLLEAESERDARRQLKRNGVYATQLLVKSSLGVEGPRRSAWSSRVFVREPSIQERIVFTRQLASLVAAGIPVDEALANMESQVGSGRLGEIIAELRNSVIEGLPLSGALERFPGSFSDFYTNLVRVGESGGALDTVLHRLAEVMDAQRRLRGRVSSAMIYPAIMGITGIVVLAFLMGVVVPKVLKVFTDSEQALPFVTQVLVVSSGFLQNYGGQIIAFLLVAGIAMRWWVSTRRGRRAFERMMLNTPLVSSLPRKVIAQRLSQTLALLLRSGVPVVKALEVSAKVSGYSLVQEAMTEAAQNVERGESLTKAMAKTGFMPGLALRLIQAGEVGGRLESMLDSIAGIYSDELEQSTERAMNMVEPVIILLMGVVVAFVVVAILLPLFEMNQLVIR